MRCTLFMAVLVCQVGLAAAQGPPEERQPEDEQRSRLREQVGRLLKAAGELGDWDTHSAYLVAAVEKVYERNGWDSEADGFSLHLVREVNTIPPWSPLERFERAMELVGQRYGFDERQEQVVRDLAIRESNEMFQKHSGRIMQYAMEAIQTRAAGEPFTPEQVARWARLAEPVFQESRERFNGAAETLMTELREDQRAILQRDMEAANRRMEDIHTLADRWAQGGWQASDWGLEDDPIQLGGEVSTAAVQPKAGTVKPPAGRSTPPPTTVNGGRARRPTGTARPAQPARPPSAGPGDRTRVTPGALASPEVTAQGSEENDPWAQYVRRFIEKYALDEAQQSKAWKIYRDVKGTGDKYSSRYGQQIEAARERVKGADDEKGKAAVKQLEEKLKGHLDKLFSQLKQRLERLPTRAQRRDAAPIDLDKPEPKKAKSPVKPMAHDGP